MPFPSTTLSFEKQWRQATIKIYWTSFLKVQPVAFQHQYLNTEVLV